MKKLSFIFILMLTVLALLVSCSSPECDHKNVGDDGICDDCGEKVKEPEPDDECEHENVNASGVCTDCGEYIGTDDTCKHIDADDNGKCDKCNENFTDGCDADHKDSNDDGKCDFGGESFEDGCDHFADSGDDGVCDACGKNLEDCSHLDKDDNLKCDKCGIDFDDGEEVTLTIPITRAGSYSSKINIASTSVSATVNAPLEIEVSFAKYYRFDKSEPAGTYDEKTGILTIPNIAIGTQRILIYAREEYEFYYDFEGGALDETSKGGGDFYTEGTEITVTAGDTSKQFSGWSYGKSLANGGTLLSTERTFTFALTKAITTTSTSLKIAIYPNYIEANVYIYDPNGGSINANSVNVKNSSYYEAAVNKDGKLQVTLGTKYFSTVGVASTFYDDGTFYRDGYILMEYNTKPDGTGEGFNLGAKYAIESEEGGVPTLYCIWAEATPESSFVYKDVNIALPSGSSSTKVPYWSEAGVEITSYEGNEKIVVIPEKIGGKYVTSIAAGAFDGKDVETLIMGRRMLRIEDGAFKNCVSLKVMYFSDGVTYISDNFMDTATKKNFTDLRMNAVMPPKFSPNAWSGLFAIKLTRVMSTRNTKRLIMIGGSSIYEGVGSEYLEALLNDGKSEQEYSFINFGTTRTLTIMLYLDAIEHYTDEDDMVIISPENHARAMGDMSFVKNSYDDAEGMYPSLMRYLDISNYTGVFTSLSEINLDRAKRNPTRYEDICNLGGSNKYGDDVSDYERRSKYRNESGCIGYTDTYIITFNERIKSAQDGSWSDDAWQTVNRDWRDLNNVTWCSFNDPKYADQMNRMIREIKASGASVYFGFAPVDGTGIAGSDWGVIPECREAGKAWLDAYDALLLETYELDGLIGKSSSYIYHHNYFYDNAYHLNNWGRTLRTYQLYIDLCDVLGIKNPVSATAKGTDFEGCLFEADTTGTNPKYTVDWIK